MVSPNFIYGGFTVENSDGKSQDFPVRLIKGASLALFEITMLILDKSYKLREDIGCMEGKSLCVLKIAIKVITKATIFGRN